MSGVDLAALREYAKTDASRHVGVGPSTILALLARLDAAEAALVDVVVPWMGNGIDDLDRSRIFDAAIVRHAPAIALAREARR